MKLLHIDSSVLGPHSVSRQLSSAGGATADTAAAPTANAPTRVLIRMRMN